MADLVTGLVLTAALLFGAGYVIRELAGDSLKTFFSAHTARTSEDPNNRLIGEIGEVVDAGRDGELKVRIGIERWNARLADEDAGAPPLGATVKVTGVEGLRLRVEPHDAA